MSDSPKKRRRQAPSEPIDVPMDVSREVEMNPRQATVAADRVATYAGPFGIRVRFLNAVVMPPTMLHPYEYVLEITNLADVVMPVAIAKRLMVDLQRSIDEHDQRMGQGLSAEELGEAWARGARVGPMKRKCDKDTVN